MRKIFGTVAGVAVAILTITALEYLATRLFPTLAEFETADDAAVAAMIAAMPFGAKLLIVAGWGLGAFTGALVAFRAAKWEAAGWIVALFVVAGGIINIVTVPHPFWMQLCAVATPFVGALFGYGLYRRWQR